MALAIARSQRCSLGCTLTIFSCVMAAVSGAEPSTTSVTAVQKAVSDWARVREEAVRLESAWESEKPLLQSTTKAMQERAQALADDKKSLQAKTASERDSVTALIKENTTSQTTLDQESDRLKRITDELVELRPMMPPRLSLALELPFRSLADPKLSLGVRMQFVTTILNRCAQFNNAISYGEELLTFPGENTSQLLEVVYWGASHAYAWDRANAKAYYGAPSARGWTWDPAPHAAKAVAELIAIYREKSDPHFVEVPAQFQHVTAISNP